MRVIPARTIELAPPNEVVATPVPCPNPGGVIFESVWLISSILTERNTRRYAENAAIPARRLVNLGCQPRADVQPHAVVDIGLPANRLFVERLPSNKDVVGLFASKNFF